MVRHVNFYHCRYSSIESRTKLQSYLKRCSVVVAYLSRYLGRDKAALLTCGYPTFKDACPSVLETGSTTSYVVHFLLDLGASLGLFALSLFHKLLSIPMYLGVEEVSNIGSSSLLEIRSGWK
jgi:hypothetical protein